MKLNKEIIFRNIAYFSSILLILGLFVNITEPIKKGVFDLFYEFVLLTTFTFTLLWLKRKIILIGLIIFVIGFNINLLYNPILRIDSEFLTPTLWQIGLIIQGISIIHLLLGTWDNAKNKLWVKIDVKLNIILVSFIIITLLFQSVFRYI